MNAMKKPKPETESQVRYRVPEQITLRPDPELRDAMQRYIDSQRVKVTAPAIVITSLIEFLQNVGCLPGDSGDSRTS